MKTKKYILISVLALLVAVLSCNKDHEIPVGQVFNSGSGGGNSGGGGGDEPTYYDYSRLRLNELNGNDKFIEIYNTSNEAINMEGVCITKDDNQNWIGTAGVTIEAHGYLLLFSEDVLLDHEDYPEALIFYSGLSAKKNIRIQLYSPTGESVDDFNLTNIELNGEAYGYANNAAPASYSRNADGRWYYADATPGAVNVDGENRVLGLDGSPTPFYLISVSSSPTEGGTVTGGGTYLNGEYCTLTATANDGYSFSYWTENGDIVSSNSSFSFVVESARTLVANFSTKLGEVQTLPYSQSFATEFGTYMTYDVMGAQSWMIEYSTAKISGYVTGVNYTANEDWLISSPVAITGVNNAKLTMAYIGRYFGDINNDVTIWASIDYIWGNAPETANWEQVPSSLSEGTDWSDFLTAEIALTDYVGQTVTFAVKYLSTNTEAGTLEIQSITIEESTITPTPSIIFSESFAEGQGSFTIQNVIMPNELAYIWAHSPQYQFMKATGYVGQSFETESWLVSPVIDLTEVNSATLSFEQAVNYADPQGLLSVLVSSDYYDDVTTATWYDPHLDQWPSGTDWAIIPSTCNLTYFVGNHVNIAFKYTSTTSTNPTWEVKNIVVSN